MQTQQLTHEIEHLTDEWDELTAQVAERTKTDYRQVRAPHMGAVVAVGAACLASAVMGALVL